MRSSVVPAAVVPAAAAAVAVLALPTVAHADPPARDLPPQPDSFSVVETACGDDVLVEGDGKFGSIRYDDSTGRQIFPRGRLTLTNLVTGESIGANASGPAYDTFVPTADGGSTLVRVGTGGWVIPTDGTILAISGRWTGTLVVDAAGDLVSLEYDFGAAKVVDLCDELN